MPKLLLAASLPAMDWKTRSTGAPLFDGFQRSCDMRQHAGVCVGMSQRRAHLVDHREQVRNRREVVGGGVDADHRVAAAIEQGRR